MFLTYVFVVDGIIIKSLTGKGLKLIDKSMKLSRLDVFIGDKSAIDGGI